MPASRIIHLPRLRCRTGAPRATRGFVLLEALVAIFLFVLGVLGILGLQTSMTAIQTDTRLRSEAAYLAQELVGLMWADIPNRGNYALDSADDKACKAAACLRWLDKVQAILPQGEAVVTVDDLASGDVGSDVAITVNWRMPNGEQHQYQTNTTIALGHTP